MTSQWKKQLDNYFNKSLKHFEVELDLQGTEFQQRVWTELLKIPFGKTVTYKELTLRIGDIKAIRAVAAANAANPVSIIVPCHRVIGSDGSLTGYAGELWRKQWLLDFERGDLFVF
jgi:methylated-DNA-[protein]-cysteine S-methyltransferase